MDKRIEFGEFRLTEKTKQNILHCLESGWLTNGPVVKQFEEKWKNLFGYKYAKALNSGTSADMACCMALYDVGAQQGDEIICPALSFIATGNSIRAAGFKPVFVDVKCETLNIDETLIEKAITNKTRAIMSVNLMGRPCELDIIQDICKKYKFIHIVDNCEAYGSKFKDKFALDYADIETSSHFTAHIAFCVEGGMVSTNDSALNDVIESIRTHGRYGGQHYFNHPIFGLNFKPTDLHYSVGLEEIENFVENWKIRKYNIYRMESFISGFKDLVYYIEEDKDRVNAPHAFSITFKKGGLIQGLRDKLDKANIAWKRNFGCMPTQHNCFAYLGYKLGDFPNAEWIGNNGLHIGVHKYLTEEDRGKIQDVIWNYLHSLRG